ncbi:MAG: metal-dependent hydrolase [Azoarcus sp.]|nr:metal-dependent hydrolase [Azoarcus sp.]
MDTLTHALSGALAGRLLAPRANGTAARPVPPVWQAVVAGAAAAAFPDLDFVLGYVSELTYLRGHRGVTHSLLLLPLWALLVSWLMAGVFRLRRGKGPTADWRAFYLIVCVSIFVHILGDLITQFGTMILAPFSDRRFGWGTTFIIDLGFTGIILAGLAASAVWQRSRVPAGVALLALAGWVGLSAVGRGEAIEVARAYAAAGKIEAVALDAVPRPASPFNWTAVVFDGEHYHYAHINTRRSEPLVATESDNFIRRLSAHYQPVAKAKWVVQPKFGNGEAGTIARKVWAAEDFAFYRWFAMFPVLDHVEMAGSAGACANFMDLRFETPGRDAAPFRYGLCGSAEAGRWRLFERVLGGRRWVDVGG